MTSSIERSLYDGSVLLMISALVGLPTELMNTLSVTLFGPVRGGGSTVGAGRTFAESTAAGRVWPATGVPAAGEGVSEGVTGFTVDRGVAVEGWTSDLLVDTRVSAERSRLAAV